MCVAGVGAVDAEAADRMLAGQCQEGALVEPGGASAGSRASDPASPDTSPDVPDDGIDGAAPRASR